MESLFRTKFHPKWCNDSPLQGENIKIAQLARVIEIPMYVHYAAASKNRDVTVNLNSKKENQTQIT